MQLVMLLQHVQSVVIQQVQHSVTHGQMQHVQLLRHVQYVAQQMVMLSATLTETGPSLLMDSIREFVLTMQATLKQKLVQTAQQMIIVSAISVMSL